jgi:hypothetical protein
VKDQEPKGPIEAGLADEGRRKRWNSPSTPASQEAKFPSTPALPSNVAHQRRRKAAPFLRKQKL